MPLSIIPALCLTLIIALAGGFILTKTGMPASWMVGALISVSVFSVATGLAVFPGGFKTVTQALAGLFVGITINRQNVKNLKRVVKAVFVMLPMMLGFNLLLGIIMRIVGGMDTITAFLSTIPGGVTDITLISADLGAHTSTVALLQLSRLFFVLLTFPPTLKLLSFRFDKKTAATRELLKTIPPGAAAIGIIGGDAFMSAGDLEKALEARAGEPPVREILTRKQLAARIGCTLAVSAAGGLLGYITKLPAGAMIFSMLFVAVFNVATNKAFMPDRVRKLTQVCAGALIGAGFTMADLLGIGGLIIPAIILLAGCLVMNLTVGLVLHRFCGLDLTTALFSATPAGAGDMCLIADELGASSAEVSVLHIIRVIAVVAVFPPVLSFVAGLIA